MELRTEAPGSVDMFTFHSVSNKPVQRELTVRRFVELSSAGQTRQTLRSDQPDLTGAAAAQNALYAVRGEQRRGLAALPLAPVVDVFLELAVHVDALVRLVSVTPVTFSPLLSLSLSLSLSFLRSSVPYSSGPVLCQAGVSV